MPPPFNITIATALSAAAVRVKNGWLKVCFGGGAAVFFVNAFCNVKIGVTRKLGIQQQKHTENKTVDDRINYRRRLGLLERWYVAHSRSGCHTGFMLCLEMNGTVPSVHRMKELLGTLANSQPWLRTCVKRDWQQEGDKDNRSRLENPWTEPVEPLWGDDLYVETTRTLEVAPFVNEVVLDNDGDLTKALEAEGATEWHDEDPTQPLWRVTIVRYLDCGDKEAYALIWCFHHLIADGLSACHLVQTFLPLLQDPPGLLDSERSAAVACLPPPMEDVLDANPTLGHIIVPVLLDRFPSLTAWFKPPYWKGSRDHKDESAGNKVRTSHMVRVQLLPDVQALEKTLFQKKLSSNSVLVASLMKAVQTVVGKEEAHRFKVTIAASERGKRAGGVTPSDMGVYLSGPQAWCAPYETEAVWELARRFRNKLKRGLRTSCQDMGLVKFIQEDWIQFANKCRKERPNGVQESLETSNLGLVDLTEGADQDCKVKNMWFAQGRKGFGAAITVCIVSTKPGGTNAVLSAFPQAVPQSELQNIAARWKSELEAALHE